jgi:hypothetical protein
VAIQFEQPLTAGTVLVRSDVRSQNYVQGSAGWIIEADGDAEFNSVVIRGGQVVGGTALYYSGTPAAGNLVMSISATAGTDSFGNAYTAGVGIYGTGRTLTVKGSTGDTAVLSAAAPSGIAESSAPGLVLSKASGDVTAASLTEFDDTFSRGVYLRSPSPLDVDSSGEGVDYGAMRMTGRFHGSDPQILLAAGSVPDAPDGGIWVNGTFFDAEGRITAYGGNFTTFTPTVGNTGGATWSTRTGWWCQVGGMRFVCIYLVASGAGSGSGIVTVSVPFNVDRSTRQVLTLHGETVGVNGGGTGIRGGECVFFTGGSGGTADRLRVDDRDGDGENNILGADILNNTIITIQGWLREDGF